MSSKEAFDRFNTWFSDYLENAQDTSRIDVIPSMCGVGKSTAVSYHACAEISKWYGAVLVVTDRKDRMSSYLTSDNIPEEMRAFFQEHSHEWCRMRSIGLMFLPSQT